MKRIETRLAKLEEQFSNRHLVALDWLLCFLRALQGEEESRQRLQQSVDSPISRTNTERMHRLARWVLSGQLEPEPDPGPDIDMSIDAPDSGNAEITNELDRSE